MASAPSVEEVVHHHFYMQRNGYPRADGAVLLSAHFHDMLMGPPRFIWDDVSSLQAPREALTFAGSTPVALDVTSSFSMPGACVRACV